MSAAIVTVTVTVLNAVSGGFATVFPCGSGPEASSLNFAAGPQAVPNELVAKLSASGTLCVYAYSQVDVVVDVVGYID